MSNILKQISYIITAAAVAFAAGYYSRKPQQIVHVEERVVEKIVEKVVEQEYKKQKKITKIVERPDGTKETTIIDNTEESTKKEKETDKKTKQSKVATETKQPTLPNYSVSAQLDASELFDNKYKVSQIDVGYRLFGGLWATAGYGFENKTIGIGIRIDF